MSRHFTKTAGSTRRPSLNASISKYALIYGLLVIPVAYLLIYHYYPILLQIIVAFKDYRLSRGVFDSDWIGLGNFRKLFGIRDIDRVLANTVNSACFACSSASSRRSSWPSSSMTCDPTGCGE